MLYILQFVCLLILMDETIRISLCLSFKIIFNICPHPCFVSCLLSSHIYGTYCNVYTVQCNVSTDSSLFVWLSRLTKPKQKQSLNEIFNQKLSIQNLKCKIILFLCFSPPVAFLDCALVFMAQCLLFTAYSAMQAKFVCLDIRFNKV